VTGSLRDNYTQPNTEYGKMWIDYGLKRATKYFHGFTPISNLGLYLWNADIFNRYERTKDTVKYRNLHKQREKYE
jgi:hypothetical protein